MTPSAATRTPSSADSSNGVAGPADPRAAGMSESALERMTAVFAEHVDRGLLPGAVMLVARHGRLAWLQAVGRRAPGEDAPMRADSIFRIYSMTKPIVSVATMMLVEQGEVLLTDPVSRFVPEFSGQTVGVDEGGALRRVPVTVPATIQDLLRHTSGLAYEFTGESEVQRLYVAERVGSRRRDNAEFAAHLGGLPLMHQPGTRWEYSRATDVLGRVVEVASGATLGSFVRERITDPLGMPDTGFSVPAAQQHRLAEAFATDPDTGEPVTLYDVGTAPRFESGGGGMVSTASDYARFAQMLLNRGSLDGARVLGSRTVDWMTADHLGTITSASPILPPGYGFGLGFAVRREDGVAATPGRAGQYYWEGMAGTTFWVDPRESMTAVMMIQAPGRREYFRNLFRTLAYAAIED